MNNVCPSCKAEYKISAKHIGRSIRCKHCDLELHVTSVGLVRASSDHSIPITRTESVAIEKSDVMYDYLTYRKMIIPILVPVMFWLGAFISVAFGILLFVTSFNVRDGGTQFIQCLIGLAYIIIGPIIIRIWCELMIVVFRIYESLVEIKVLVKNRNS